MIEMLFLWSNHLLVWFIPLSINSGTISVKLSAALNRRVESASLLPKSNVKLALYKSY